LDDEFVLRSISIAKSLGFRRVHFTGGEPLLYPNVVNLIARAKEIFSDIGMTTNGTHLPKYLDQIVDSGVNKIHISLIVEHLKDSGNSNSWGMPKWLREMSEKLADNTKVVVRLNLPFIETDADKISHFLKLAAPYPYEVMLFSLLPNLEGEDKISSIRLISEIAQRVNEDNLMHGLKGRVGFRGYRTPEGIRCSTCTVHNFCRDYSRALRLGADKILRPCLATRKWDLDISHNLDLQNQFESAALLALDYVW
jgi:molybdenum cofactor biosynthesis enzyme MoaA